MGSTDTPSSSSNPANQLQHEQQQYDSNLSSTELANLLEQKDREIYALKFELEKYKLALHQSQLGHRYFQQQQQIHEHESETLAKDNVDSLINSDQFEQKPALVDALTLSSTQVFLGDVVDRSVDAQHKKLLAVGDSEEVSEFGTDEHSVSKISSSQSTRLPLNRQSIASACSNMSGSSSKVVFEAGADEDDELDDVCSMSQAADDDERDMSENIVGDIVSDDLQDIIQDVGEIDLDLEFDSNRVEDSCYRSISSDQMPRQPNKHSDVPMTGNINGGGDDADDDDDDDGDHDAGDDGENDQGSNEDVGGNVITDRLLTSFTDAAINNLSQLAALQERCESQQHSQYQNHQHSKTESTDTIESTQQPKSLTSSQLTDHQAFVPTNPVPPPRRSSTSGPVGLGSIDRTSSLSMNIGARDVQGPCVGFHLEDRFPSSAQATQATAAAVAALANKLQNSTSMIGHLNKTDLLSSSVSPNSSSRLQVDHGGGRSLASVVAAAAAAAVAAANSNHNHHQHHNRPTHQIQSTPQSRLISSALPTSEFYRNLQQQQQQHQQLPHAHQISPVSSIHFSPSTSITPSPLFGQSRRSASNTSSSLLSPIASPSYLKRQFMPDRLLMMSPSPTSLTTGSNSCNSSSLAQILQQHHLGQQHQQRSATALGGTISSPSGTSISGTGSAAMSPLMSSKNSSQARLNNMQIRHKFGYLGSTRAQFNSPHGFCLGLNQEIVVADTNNHRIAIFDNTGTYISQFGAAGKEEGQLWNPRKVAILHRPTNGGVGSGGGGNGSVGSSLQQRQGQITAASTTTSVSSDHFASEPLFVVCDRGAERSRMQLFTKDGAFIKKIGIHYIDIVAGLAITQDGLIIVVDSVSPTVYIINGETGSLNGWFDCSGHMKEPSDIAVKSEASRNEYFICDFKGHCVVVFSEQGDYLRKIGHDGLTSYPNGIDISDDGDILVGDSHGNRFHVVVFDRNGNFVSQFECPHVKVSRCCGLKITREGYIVTLAKNNHHVLVLDTIHI